MRKLREKIDLSSPASGKQGKNTFKVTLRMKKGVVIAQDAKFKLVLLSAPASVTASSPFLIVIGNTVFSK